MSAVDDIKARLDIVDVVSGYVALQKAGRNYKACCPLHNEKTPSFVVTPERQSWRCFGACSTGGDMFSFVMRMDNMEFGDALKLLAGRAGVTLPSAENRERNDAYFQINREAARFYQEQLASPEGTEARAYLEKRGVDSQAVDTFQLGFSGPDRSSLKRHLTGLGFDLDETVRAGVVRRGDGGDTWDFFGRRLMFPIHARDGKVVGFGARSLDGSEPKYLNTARTPVFDKRATLYALHLAAPAIKEQGSAVIVEGYMDVIAAHQHGYHNVVASMGTALTDRQVAQLRSIARDFVLALDPDVAGLRATIRSLASSWHVLRESNRDRGLPTPGVSDQPPPRSLKIADLPPGRDPDELIRGDSALWERLITSAEEWRGYYIRVVSAGQDLSTPEGKARAAEGLIPVITSAGSGIEQSFLLEQAAEALGVSADALRASIGSPRAARDSARHTRRRPAAPRPQPSAAALSGDAAGPLEGFILALLLRRPDLKKRVEGFAAENFHQSPDREVFTRWLTSTTIDELEESLNQTLREHLHRIMLRKTAPTDRKGDEAALEQCLSRLEMRHIKGLQQMLLSSQDTSLPPPRELEEAMVGYNTRVTELSARR